MEQRFGTVVVLCREDLVRELFVEHLRSMTIDIEIEDASSISSLDSKTIAASTVLAFIKSGYAVDELLAEIERVRKQFPDNPVAVISDFHRCEITYELLELGVKGLLPTGNGGTTLIHGLRLLIAGGGVIPPDLVVHPHQNNGSRVSHRGKAPKPLTSVERHVLDRVRSGKPNKIIALELSLPESAVKNHIRTLMKKTGTRNRVELAMSHFSAIEFDS